MERLRVIFGREALLDVDELFVPLEIDRTVLPSGRIQDVFLIVYPEELPVEEADYLPELVALHKNLILLFRQRDWWQCLDIISVLYGRWNGWADSYYASIIRRIELYSECPPTESWQGEYWEPDIR